jgi:hypothetical protein
VAPSLKVQGAQPTEEVGDLWWIEVLTRNAAGARAGVEPN